MTRYIEIFNEIVDIVHHDYAGYEEKQGWDNPEYYRNKIENELEITPQKFKEIIDSYLVGFQEPHMYFDLRGSGNVKASTSGFLTRRYKDALYVTETIEESRFPKGTKIISIDNQTIEQLVASNQNVFGRASAEREDWTTILNKSSRIVMENEQGKQLKMDLNKYEPVFKKKNHSLEVINEDTLLIILPGFQNVDDTLAFISNHEAKFKSGTNLIVDVRNNHGGNGQAYSTLLPYIFPRGERPSTKSELREFNYTKRNADLFAQLCQKIRNNTKDKRTLEVLNFAEEQCEKHRGQGFVQTDFSKLMKEEDSQFEGTDSPEKVIVLTDVYCASAGEYFVQTCMESSKVTVIGRATMGVNDYSDLVIKDWDDMFSLYYPISRRVKKTVNDPLHGKGIQPDHYISWTPEHIQRDKDLSFALEMLQEGVNR